MRIEEDTAEQIKEALNALKEKEEVELYEYLISEQDIYEPSFADVALEQGIFYPATLYKDALPQLRDTVYLGKNIFCVNMKKMAKVR